MKLKEMFKRFWTLDVHSHKGFTLVELIIVIAILAILSSVAVVGYSSYIKKANMQADRTLAAEVENALLLGYYSEGFNDGSATVILTTEGAYCVVEGASPIKTAAEAAAYLAANDGTAMACALKAMANAYGDDWFSTLKLKYSDWEINSVSSVVAAYNNSSFNGQHEELLETVQNLTDKWMAILSSDGAGEDNFITELIGGSYDQYLKDNNVDKNDKQAFANTAVTYVSYRTNAMDAATRASFITAWSEAQNVDGFINACKDDKGKSILGTAGSMAALFAKAEALCRYFDTNRVPFVDTTIAGVSPYTTWSAWMTAQQAEISGLNAIQLKNSVDQIFNKLRANIANNNAAVEKYGQYSTPAGDNPSQAEQDAKAYLEILGVIDDSSAVMMENLSNDNLYGGSVCNDLLNGYLNLGNSLADIDVDNGIGIVMFQNDGECVTIVYPLDYLK